MIYSNSMLILKVKCFVLFEKPFECLTNIWIAIDVWSRYDVLNGIDKYIQCITVCFLYPDITDLNNNEIDDFQELFLNLLLDIKDGLFNQNGTSWLILLNLKWNQEQLLLKVKLHLKVWGCLVDKHKNILMS